MASKRRTMWPNMSVLSAIFVFSMRLSMLELPLVAVGRRVRRRGQPLVALLEQSQIGVQHRVADVELARGLDIEGDGVQQVVRDQRAARFTDAAIGAEHLVGVLPGAGEQRRHPARTQRPAL